VLNIAVTQSTVRAYLKEFCNRWNNDCLPDNPLKAGVVYRPKDYRKVVRLILQVERGWLMLNLAKNYQL